MNKEINMEEKIKNMIEELRPYLNMDGGNFKSVGA